MCFADQFSTPIFLPLIAVYKIFDGVDITRGQEFLFILLYWAVLGFLIGLILDLWPKRDPYTVQSQYSPSPHLPPSQTSAPVSQPPSQASPTL